MGTTRSASQEGSPTLLLDGPGRQVVQAPPLKGGKREHSQRYEAAAMFRILVVDPEARSRRAVARLLQEWGYEVTVADSPAAAVTVVTPKDFDLLIADVGGPRPDGLALAQAFKRENP